MSLQNFLAYARSKGLKVHNAYETRFGYSATVAQGTPNKKDFTQVNQNVIRLAKADVEKIAGGFFLMKRPSKGARKNIQ